jgi:hypothetical protein
MQAIMMIQIASISSPASVIVCSFPLRGTES